MRRRPRPLVWPRAYGDSGIKASATGPLIATHVAHTPQYTPRRYDRLADEAYAKNVIAYLCVRLIADAVASLRLMVFKGEKEIEGHDLQKLLKRQNPMTTGPRWWRELVAYHLLAGNAYIEAVGPRPTEPPRELWNLRPDRMKVIPGDDGMPESYRYEVNGQTRDFPVNLVAGAVQLLHVREFHPLHDWYGMSPVEAAARYIDMDNAASDHNLGRLQNGANPSGLVVFKEKLLPDQAKAAEEKIQAKLGGARNAGRIQVVGGGEWDFKRVGDSNVDMQWLEGMSETARRICAAWNVPHILVVAGESTYNNRQSARVELWLHTVLPYFDMLLGDVNPWLQRMYGDDELEIRYDRASIAALEPVRKETREQARADWQAGAITLNEFRAEIDYGEVPNGDELQPQLANVPVQANAQQEFDLQQEGLDRADAREAAKRPQVEQDAKVAHDRALELEDRRAKNRQGTKDRGGPARKAEDPFSATDALQGDPFYAYLEVQAPRRLTRWMRSVGIPKPVAAGKLHLTTVYSAIPPKGYEPSQRSETLDPARYRLERLGPDGAVLALVVDSDLAWDRMQAAMAAGAVPAWPTLIPHITLSYDAGEFQIPDHPPDFPITVGPEVIGSGRKGNYPKIPDSWGIVARADDPDFSDIPDSLNDDILADTARSSLLGIVRDFGQRTIQRISVTLGFDVRSPAVEGFLARWGGERIRDLVGTTTRRELGEALARVTAEGPTFPKLVAAVQATFDRADKVRAEVIARTETTRAAGFGSQEGMVQGNVERKQWISSRDAFVRDAHAELDGQIVEADQPYVWEGNKAMFPGDFAKAALSVNCRCVSIAIPDEASASRLSTKDARAIEWSEQDNLLLHHERLLVAALREGFGRQQRGVLQALARRMMRS